MSRLAPVRARKTPSATASAPAIASASVWVAAALSTGQPEHRLGAVGGEGDWADAHRRPVAGAAAGRRGVARRPLAEELPEQLGPPSAAEVAAQALAQVAGVELPIHDGDGEDRSSVMWQDGWKRSNSTAVSPAVGPRVRDVVAETADVRVAALAPDRALEAGADELPPPMAARIAPSPMQTGRKPPSNSRLTSFPAWPACGSTPRRSQPGMGLSFPRSTPCADSGAGGRLGAAPPQFRDGNLAASRSAAPAKPCFSRES